MRLNKFLLIGLCFTAVLGSCEKDDDDPGKKPVEIRDPEEQKLDDQEALEAYLATHFYNYEEFENPTEDFDYQIEFDTIAGENADKTSLIESDLLEAKTVTSDSVDYTIYILKVREGVGEQPTFADSTFVSYDGELLSGISFDNTVNPVWFDLVTIVPGLTHALTEFRGGSGYSVNPDNSVEWENDYGIGAVFFPSGLGYYNAPQPGSGIPPYSPLIFNFNLFLVNQADHDQDGIPSFMEDLNGDEDVRNDNTDSDRSPNYLDYDDDNDFTPTREEIIINEDGTIEFPDSDGDGEPDYLDSSI